MDTLYKKNKNGSYQQWTISTASDSINTEYGQVGGQLQTTSKRAIAKNVGRANEVKPEDQAILEAQSMWKKKLDSGYAKSIKEADEVLILPMLAKSYDDYKGKIVWGTHYIQPKIDGVRCIARWVDGKLKLFSRKNKEWTNLGHIVTELEGILPQDFIMDGEIYLHGLTFQEITSLTKKHRTIPTQKLGQVDTCNLEYHVYDGFKVGGEAVPFDKRIIELWEHTPNDPDDSKIISVLTHKVYSTQQVTDSHRDYVKVGYEGAILRIAGSPYHIGHRSADLLKIKTFMDKEFKIVSCYEGVGRFKGAVTWICKLEDGRECHCVPKGTMGQKQEWFRDSDKYIGKFLKVKFFEWTDEGLPRFPVGLGIRLEKDM